MGRGRSGDRLPDVVRAGQAPDPAPGPHPGQGAALLVANHISHLDPVISGLIVHRSRRVPRFLAKHSLWNVPVLGSALRGSGQIPVYRESADAQQSLRDGVAALNNGKVVVIYPEGTITRDPDGWPMHARTGVARLALRHRRAGRSRSSTGAPARSTTATTRSSARCRASRSPCASRRPVDLSAYRGRPIDAALLREVTDLLMARVRDLLAEVRGEPAPTEFFRTGGLVTGEVRAGRGPRRRLVGHCLREGARRTPVATSCCGRGDPRWPPAINERHINPDYLPGIVLPRHAHGHDERRGGARRRRRGGARRAVADAARQPRRLARPAAAGRHAGQPGEGRRAGHAQADERGGRRGRRASRPTRSPSCPVRTWPARSPRRSRPPPSSPAPTTTAPSPCSTPAPPATSARTPTPTSSAASWAVRARTSSRWPAAWRRAWASATTPGRR